jgi:ABC-type cobalamin/Fe3+-siderophores transport system ATPase subunit
MPCQSYDSRWEDHSDDRDKIRELKKQADMLARIACKALAELEANEIEDILLLRDDEVREWWQAHKEADRKAAAARAEKERKEKVKEEALAKLSHEERELLGLAPKVAQAKRRTRGPIKPAQMIRDALKLPYDVDEDEDE